MSFFEDLKVVELANILAGPLTGRFFAENGAQVIKIENPNTGGDLTRQWKLSTEDPQSEFSAYYAAANYNKDIKMLDFANEEDCAELKAMIQDADIVISNFKQSTLKKYNLDYESLKSSNQNLIFGQINGFPDSGSPYRPAFDVVLQAETGFLSMTGQPDGPPSKMPVALIDIIASHQLREGILTALWKREKTKKGAYVKTSLFESAIASLANQATNYLMEGHIAKPMGTLHPNIAPYGEIFATNDKRKVILAIGSEKHFQALCNSLKLVHLTENPLFSTNQSRVENRQELFSKLEATIASMSSSEFMKLMNQSAIPAGQINDLKDVLTNIASQRMILKENLSPEYSARSMASTAFQLEA